MTEVSAEMIDRAALVIRDRLDGLGVDGSLWGDELDSVAEDLAAATIAVALRGCEVREEWVVLVDGPTAVGTVVMEVSDSRAHIEDLVADAKQYPRRLGRRLVITTAPERIGTIDDPAGVA
jgi:hypothetical protein